MISRNRWLGVVKLMSMTVFIDSQSLNLHTTLALIIHFPHVSGVSMDLSLTPSMIHTFDMTL